MLKLGTTQRGPCGGLRGEIDKGGKTMTNRNYPTRMHEVLGVETGEVFTVTWSDTKQDFSLDGFGIPKGIETEDIDGLRYPASVPDVVYMVNHPERITRHPRLTEEQVAQLKALDTLGFKWLAKDENDEVVAFKGRPDKGRGQWQDGGEYIVLYPFMPTKSLMGIPSWSDPEPLDIVATLKAAGVEVE